jgi:hypothetical protein
MQVATELEPFVAQVCAAAVKADCVLEAKAWLHQLVEVLQAKSEEGTENAQIPVDLSSMLSDKLVRACPCFFYTSHLCCFDRFLIFCIHRARARALTEHGGAAAVLDDMPLLRQLPVTD